MLWFRKVSGLEYGVEHVLAGLLKIPEQLEVLYEAKLSKQKFHRDSMDFHANKAVECQTEAEKASHIAVKLRELLS